MNRESRPRNQKENRKTPELRMAKGKCRAPSKDLDVKAHVKGGQKNPGVTGKVSDVFTGW